MPTIQDIANQVNNTLTQINQNTQDTANTLALVKGDTADLNAKMAAMDTNLSTRLDQLHALNQAGFLFLGQGLFALLEEAKKGNSLLEANVQQNQAIICELKNSNDLLCRILHRQNTQVDLQEEIEDHQEKVRGILELVHPGESGEVDRLAQLTAKIEKCCPPKPPEPERCPPTCDVREIKIYQPDDRGWTVPGKPNDLQHMDALTRATKPKKSAKGHK